jgi:hypothetical protein
MDRFIIRSKNTVTRPTASTSKLSHCDSDTVHPGPAEVAELVPTITPAQGVKRSLSLEKPMVHIAPADSDCTFTQETGLFVLLP